MIGNVLSETYLPRGLAVANGSCFWGPRREIGSTRLESPRE